MIWILLIAFIWIFLAYIDATDTRIKKPSNDLTKHYQKFYKEWNND